MSRKTSVLTAGPADRCGRLLPKGDGYLDARTGGVNLGAALDRSPYTAAGASNRMAWIDTLTLPPVKAPPAAVITTGVSA